MQLSNALFLNRITLWAISCLNISSQNKVTEKCRPTESFDCGIDGFCNSDDESNPGRCEYCNEIYARELGLDNDVEPTEDQIKKVYNLDKDLPEDQNKMCQIGLLVDGETKCKETCYGVQTECK